MKEKRSTRKADSNRRNAKSSTGPGDTTATRFNATKHGILTMAALVAEHEDEGMLQELSRFREGLAPVGIREEFMADELTMLLVRRLRVIRYEASAISQRMSSTAKSMKTDQTEDMARELSACNEKEPLETRPRLWTRVFEVAEERYVVCIEKLLGVEGFWDPSDKYLREEIEQVIDAACEKGKISTGEFWKVVKEATQRDHQLLNPNPEGRRLALERMLRLALLPHQTVLDKIQRYESHISRQFYKALHEFDRMQATRGETDGSASRGRGRN